MDVVELLAANYRHEEIGRMTPRETREARESLALGRKLLAREILVTMFGRPTEEQSVPIPTFDADYIAQVRKMRKMTEAEEAEFNRLRKEGLSAGDAARAAAAQSN